MKAIIIFLLISVIHCEISGQKAFEAFNTIKTIYKEKELLPYKASEKCRNNNATGLFILGGLLFFIAAPLIAPLMAPAGLFGAAAYTSGLATLGFGSLASGGFGMAGGLFTLTALGGIIRPSSFSNFQKKSYTLKDCSIENKSSDFIFDDKGKILFEGSFTKNIPESGNFYLNNKIYECNWEFCKLT